MTFLRWASIALGALFAAFILVVGAIALCLAWRAPGNTVRAVGTVDVRSPFVFTADLIRYLPFVDYMLIDGRTLYAANLSQGVLGMVATDVDTTGRTSPLIGGLGRLHGIAVDSRDGLGFVSDSTTDALDVFDLRSSKVLGKIPTDRSPDAIVYDEKFHLIYVACHSAGIGDLIDPVARRLVGRIRLGGEAEFAAVDPATGLIYQNVATTSEVVVVDPLRRIVTARFKLAPDAEPTGLALDNANHRLFVTGENDRRLFVLNSETGTILATLPIGSGADGVAYDRGLRRVYVANGLSATMTVIAQQTPDRYRVLENAPTPFLGHSVVVDPVSHRIYIAYTGKVAVYTPQEATARVR